MPSAVAEDEHPGGQTDPLGDAGEITEHDERAWNGSRSVYGREVARVRSSVHCAQYVVIGEEVVKPQVLDRFPDPTYTSGSPPSSICG